jgi:hypothetical protein
MDIAEEREICHSIRIPKLQHVEEKVLYPAVPRIPVFLHYTKSTGKFSILLQYERNQG